MRRLVAVLATIVLVPLGAGLSTEPAHAADTGVTIDGFNYPAGIGKVSRPCVSGTTYDGNSTTRLYTREHAIGDHATGYGFGGATTGESGIRVSMPNPNALTEISLETLHPLGEAGSSPGHYVVTFDPSGSG